MLTNEQQKEVLREITRVTMESLAYGHDISSILSKVDNVLTAHCVANEIDINEFHKFVDIESFVSNVINIAADGKLRDAFLGNNVYGATLHQVAAEDEDVDTIASTAYIQTLQQDNAMDR